MKVFSDFNMLVDICLILNIAIYTFIVLIITPFSPYILEFAPKILLLKALLISSEGLSMMK